MRRQAHQSRRHRCHSPSSAKESSDDGDGADDASGARRRGVAGACRRDTGHGRPTGRPRSHPRHRHRPVFPACRRHAGRRPMPTASCAAGCCSNRSSSRTAPTRCSPPPMCARRWTTEYFPGQFTAIAARRRRSSTPPSRCAGMRSIRTLRRQAVQLRAGAGQADLWRDLLGVTVVDQPARDARRADGGRLQLGVDVVAQRQGGRRAVQRSPHGDGRRAVGPR